MPSIASTFYSSPINIPGVVTFLIGRTPDLNVAMDRAEVLSILRPIHKKILDDTLSSKYQTKKLPFVIAEQIHGSEIAIVEPPFTAPVQQSGKNRNSIFCRSFSSAKGQCSTKKANHSAERVPLTDTTINIPGVDALMTSHRGVILGIDVADCAPVWIIEKNGKAGAIVHSGKKGTLDGIVPKTISLFQEKFLISPPDLIVTIGPCIRPPCYEIDFAKIIHEQAAEAGVMSIHDEKICTACHPEHYYSYRREKGKTGRMLATLLLE